MASPRDNSATWGSMFKRRSSAAGRSPTGGIEVAADPEAAFAIRLKRDGTLEGMPVPENTPATAFSCASTRKRVARDPRMPAV